MTELQMDRFLALFAALLVLAAVAIGADLFNGWCDRKAWRDEP